MLHHYRPNNYSSGKLYLIPAFIVDFPSYIEYFFQYIPLLLFCFIELNRY